MARTSLVCFSAIIYLDSDVLVAVVVVDGNPH
jgi:hypothetical protein